MTFGEKVLTLAKSSGSQVHGYGILSLLSRYREFPDSGYMAITSILTSWLPVDHRIIDILKCADENSFPELEHPGKVFYLDKPTLASQNYGIYQTSKKFFGKILLRSGLLNNHMPRAYQEAFLNIDLGK